MASRSAIAILGLVGCVHADPPLLEAPDPGLARLAQAECVEDGPHQDGVRTPPHGTPPYPPWCATEECRDVWDEKGRAIWIEALVRREHGSDLKRVPSGHHAVVWIDEDGQTRFWKQRGRQDQVLPDWLEEARDADRYLKLAIAHAKRNVPGEARPLLDQVRVEKLCGTLVVVDDAGVRLDRGLLRNLESSEDRRRLGDEIARAVSSYWKHSQPR